MKRVRVIGVSIPVLAVVLVFALVLTGRIGGSTPLHTAEAINLASAPGTFTGVISIQNPNSDAAFVVVGFYDGAGNRVTAADVPLPYAPTLEDYVLPQTDDIVTVARKLARY